MKQTLLYVVIGTALIAAVAARADVVLPNTHPVTRCVKIQNTAQFPDITVIEYLGPPGGDARYVVNQDSCVHSGYKLGSYYFLWAPKFYVDSVGIANLPIPQFIACVTSPFDSGCAFALHLFSANISPVDSVVPDSSMLIGEDLFYSLYTAYQTISLYLAKEVSHFSDGTSSTQTFLPPSGTIVPVRRVSRSNAIETIAAARGIFTFKATFTGSLKMTISDCRGRTVATYYKACAPGCTYVTDLSAIKAGMYWISLRTPNINMVRRLAILR